MRLLLDENLSESVLPALADLYPDSLHVRLLDGGWPRSMLVTRDEDFLRLSIVRGAPPKVVWIALGNCSNQEVIHLMKAHRQAIEEFAAHEQATFLTLHS